jgi:N-formylglutamate amidohydrolase
VPRPVRPQFALDRIELEREMFRMTDHFTDELFAFAGVPGVLIVYPVSRLVADPERFQHDGMEPMAGVGMGVFYTRTSDGRALRTSLPAETRRDLLRDYYRPHHDRFRQAVSRSLRANGWCLVIDAHSFPSVPLPYEHDQGTPRPDFCVGIDPFHTPRWLARHLMALLREGEYQVALNRPFAGAIVPRKYYRKDPRVLSVMVEVNRGLYSREGSAKKSRAFGAVHRHIETCVRSLLEVAGQRVR